MVEVKRFVDCLDDSGVGFFTGVPDSLLKCVHGVTPWKANPELHRWRNGIILSSLFSGLCTCNRQTGTVR